MLYIVGTPIGNLEDLSLRAAKTLVSSDIILAEDTRSAHILLEFIKKTFNFAPKANQKLISYYKEKEFEKLPEVLAFLDENKQVSLISDSGMPLLSDPGYLLIKESIKKNLPFTVIPGPSAVINALIASGFNPQNFMFIGYLPKKTKDLSHSFNRVRQMVEIEPKLLCVAYESPRRIKETLTVLSNSIPDAQVVVCREMTKKFEEITRGTPAELLKRDYKGEITLVLSLK